ncbi:MAG: hypothetical protein LBM96_06355, partial [Methanobrevibacter sp.]|nr:hypothetical protein [Candidatus Methanoflexus mossambicus]
NEIIESSESLFIWCENVETIFERISNSVNYSVSNWNILNDSLEELITTQNVLKTIKSSNNVGEYYFGSFWDGCDSNPDELNKYYETILKPFNDLFNSNFFSNDTIDILNEGIDYDKIDVLLKDLKNIHDKIIHDYNELDKLLCFDSEHGLNFVKSSDFKTLKNFFKLLNENKDNLQNWRIYKRNIHDCEIKYSDINIKRLISLIKNDKLKGELIIPTFLYNFAKSSLNKILEKNNILDSFNSERYYEILDRFRNMDRDFIELNRYRVKEVLQESRPNISGATSIYSEQGILLHEFARRRGMLPIRSLLKRCSNVIKEIKPCFMMSPLSVAKFLNPEIYESYFDYVIFDEASQLKLEDGIGAMLRGKNYVIMGDTKQLPPTNFFADNNFNDDDDFNDENYDNYNVVDVESVLHHCHNAFQNKMLKWHYRSKHESLIAVSNAEFYDNSLFVFPSSKRKTKELGLKFIHCADGIYDRGGSATNRIEAKHVIDYAIKQLQNNPNKSLGIGTFSVRQKTALYDELELRLKNKPELQEFFKESGENGFFIKNIENIQGDERDIILISVGYGFDSNKRLLLNFGPINNEGGERRLNVLITRAREKCVVFSNFRSSDLNLPPNTSNGLRVLKTFLYYAESGEFPIAETTERDFDSPFEKSVYDFLTDKGYEVEKQVGSAGYRIDLAIIDKNNRDDYILGIECDGATYHSSKVARDRDRLRQEILEGLGWKIYRIWSTDWFHNRKNAKNNLIKAIEEAIKQKSNNNLGDFENITLNNEDRINTHHSDNRIKELIVEKSHVNSSNDDIIDYEFYNLSFIYISNKNSFNRLVKEIVKKEAPIHINEIQDRVRRILNRPRLTQKLRESILSALNSNNFNQKEDFYYANNEIIIRKRDDPKIDRISNEEIEKTIIYIIKTQYGLDKDEIISQASRLLGFRATRDRIKGRYNEIIEDMLKNKYLTYSNGKLELLKHI